MSFFLRISGLRGANKLWPCILMASFALFLSSCQGNTRSQHGTIIQQAQGEGFTYAAVRTQQLLHQHYGQGEWINGISTEKIPYRDSPSTAVEHMRWRLASIGAVTLLDVISNHSILEQRYTAWYTAAYTIEQQKGLSTDDGSIVWKDVKRLKDSLTVALKYCPESQSFVAATDPAAEKLKDKHKSDNAH